MCLFPRIIKNKKYQINQKNGGIIPAVKDTRTLTIPIKCGNCIECRKQKSREWQIRLQEEIKHNKNGKFITLTFSNISILKLKIKVTNYLYSEINKEYNKKYINEKDQRTKINKLYYKLTGYGLDNEIATHAMRLFNERWRKEYKKALRHWTVTELGHNGTENIHIHGIIWTNQTMKDVERHWQYGWVWKGKKINDKIENYVNAKTVNYIVKYINKIDEIHKTYKSIILTSNGIGNQYTNTHNSTKNKYKENTTDETYKTNTGHKITLPIYWRNKIYTEEEKEKLWIEKLNKEERWIMGEKIDISKGYKEYDKLLKYYREKNKQYGYGDNSKNWEQIEYEKQRREIMLETRIQKTKK